MEPSVGRILHYCLSAEDCERINRRRVTPKPGDPAWPAGAQAHFGNHHHPEQLVPMIVIVVWADEFGPGIPGVNGQAFLDGNDSFWVLSAKEGTGPGTWRWPERAGSGSGSG